MIKTSTVLLVAASGLIAIMGAISCQDLFPIDCSNSKAAKRPSVGRQACLDLRVLVDKQPETRIVGKLVDDHDLVFNCVCGLTTNNLHFVQMSTHASRWMFNAMTSVMNTPDNSIRVLQNGGPYNKIKALAKLPAQRQSYRKAFLAHFMDNYYDLTTGKGLPSLEAAEKLAQNTCYKLVNHPIMTDYINPTLEALQKWHRSDEDRYFPLASSSYGLTHIVNMRNFCLNVVGPKEDKSLNQQTAEPI